MTDVPVKRPVYPVLADVRSAARLFGGRVTRTMADTGWGDRVADIAELDWPGEDEGPFKAMDFLRLATRAAWPVRLRNPISDLYAPVVVQVQITLR